MIPTAEEFVNQYDWENSSLNIPQVLIEFAKLHVEAALKVAHRNMQMGDEDLEFTLNAYPLTNIK